VHPQPTLLLSKALLCVIGCQSDAFEGVSWQLKYAFNALTDNREGLEQQSTLHKTLARTARRMHL
jgi:hypothetical protein